MEYKDIQKKSDAELKKILAELRGKAYETSLKLTVNQVRNVRDIRKTKKTIAQILTCLKQREYENR